MSELEAEKSKEWFASRTVWWNVAGLALFQLASWILPKSAISICANQELTIVVGLNLFSLWCLVNLWLRKTTSCRIGKPMVLVAALALTGCSSVSQQLETNTFYKRDIVVGINGEEYEGVTTAPYAKSYQFTLQPRGEIDLMLIRTCHRTYSVEKVSSGWFGKNKFAYTYTPIPGLEDTRTCPIRLDAYESSKEGRHSWAFIDFENPMYKVQATLTCDGSIRRVNGISVCQAKKDTVQRIQFQDPVRWAPPLPEGCNKAVMVGGAYEIKASLGECLYHFDTQDGRLGRLTVIGYEGVLVRSPQ